MDLARAERQQEIKGRRKRDPSSFPASIIPAQGVGSGCLAQWKVTAPVRQWSSTQLTLPLGPGDSDLLLPLQI